MLLSRKTKKKKTAATSRPSCLHTRETNQQKARSRNCNKEQKGEVYNLLVNFGASNNGKALILKEQSGAHGLPFDDRIRSMNEKHSFFTFSPLCLKH